MLPFIIRSSQPEDFATVECLVRGVVAEKYGHLFAAAPPPANSSGDWHGSLLAEVQGKIVGVGLAKQDCVYDLWLAAEYRNHGLGAALLAKLETQIAQAGFNIAQLRVVAENSAARRFYARNGWTQGNTYPHEKWGFAMVDFSKSVA
jgi:GNAT superfamily N-acetyltransferase